MRWPWRKKKRKPERETICWACATGRHYAWTVNTCFCCRRNHI